jgi:hypothetical protein
MTGGNYAGSGELDIRLWFLRVIPDNDVTRRTKDMANAGIAVATGVVPGAWSGKPSGLSAAVRECGLSRKLAGRLGDVPCKAVGTRSRATGGAGHDATTKGLTGFPVEVTCGPHDADSPWQAQAAPGEMLGGEFLLGRRTDGVRPACILKSPGCVEVFLVKGSMDWAG